jgi:putative PIG3 family NAD(P)H quinone oxidoreductase
MPAIVIKSCPEHTEGESGGKGVWSSLALEQVPRPSASDGEVLVQVEACSVNRADLLQRRGLYPPPPGASSLLGLDFAGFVAGSAPDVGRWHPGDRVFGITSGGGYGRYVSVPAAHLVAIPDNLSFVEAAAVAEAFFTAFLNIHLEAGIQPGESLLVHGGGSGIGTAAIQLAKTSKVRVIITAGSSEKIERCLKLGASHGINYKQEDFAERVLEITQGDGVDVILDMIGAPYLKRNLGILKTKGRLVLIGLMGGATTEIALGELLTKRLRLIGSILRSRTKEEKAALTQAFQERISPLLKSGKVSPVIDRIFPIAEAVEAHRYMQEGRHFGKIVLSWQGTV